MFRLIFRTLRCCPRSIQMYCPACSGHTSVTHSRATWPCTCSCHLSFETSQGASLSNRILESLPEDLSEMVTWVKVLEMLQIITARWPRDTDRPVVQVGLSQTVDNQW